METVTDEIAASADAKFQYLLESAPDAIVIVDDTGRIVIANHQVELLFGYDRAELIGQPVELLLPEHLRAIHVDHRANYSSEPRTRPMRSGYTLKARRKDGSEFPTEVSLSPLQTENGLLITSAVRDVTERLSSAEAAILQAARLAAVGQLAAAIAHEINNPLYAARNALYLLEGELHEQDGGSNYLAIAREQLTRIAGIIQRMRDFYRPARGELSPANTNQLVEDTLALAVLNTRHVAIEMIFTPDHILPTVLCNADQLRQVFLNLVLNAIEAMPDGGTLTVRTIAGPTVALIEIQDTGIGIPDDIRSHLFEPFFTNKPNGTGLGLSISAHIVTQHGGLIEVESTEGNGSIFRIVLPYKPHI